MPSWSNNRGTQQNYLNAENTVRLYGEHGMTQSHMSCLLVLIHLQQMKQPMIQP